MTGGKSTQAALLAQALDAVRTREPGGTRIGGMIRSIVLDPANHALADRAEALLSAADRAQHAAEVVRPALAAGRHVVSDRSAWSSVAYQGYGRGMDPEDVRGLSDWAIEATWPDLVVLLDIDVEGRRAAPPARPPRPHGGRRGGVLRQVTAGFAALAAADPGRWRVVDGSGSPDAVAARVFAALD